MDNINWFYITVTICWKRLKFLANKLWGKLEKRIVSSKLVSCILRNDLLKKWLTTEIYLDSTYIVYEDIEAAILSIITICYQSGSTDFTSPDNIGITTNSMLEEPSLSRSANFTSQHDIRTTANNKIEETSALFFCEEKILEYKATPALLHFFEKAMNLFQNSSYYSNSLDHITSTPEKKRIKPVEKSLNFFNSLDGITTTSEKRGLEPVEVKYAVVGRSCNHKSMKITLYRNTVRNETRRMIISIDTVGLQAMHMFGIERTQMFFDLLNVSMPHYGSAGSISAFVPNMAENDFRQHIFSFFEHACDILNRLSTSLSGCPDSTNLQQMPDQEFISLMQSVVDSSLKSNFKGERISLKGSTLIMDDLKEFERETGVKLPRDILDGFKHGEEMVAYSFVDIELERTCLPEGSGSRPIHCLYFPSDCRLFIYIPTESGSYWHMLEMQRSNRTRQHGK